MPTIAFQLTHDHVELNRLLKLAGLCDSGGMGKTIVASGVVTVDGVVNGHPTRVVFKQIAGLIARRILCYVGSGAELARGQRFGFIRFGSRVDVYLPLDAEVKAALGDKVYAAESVLAWLTPPKTKN